MNKFKSVVLLSLVGSQGAFSAGNAGYLHTIITQERIDHLREHSEILIVLNPVQHQAFAVAINGLEQQLADNNIDGLQNRIKALRAQITDVVLANQRIEYLRGQIAPLIDPNPVQHQAFADEINQIAHDADNNIDGGEDRIDALDAQIQAALVANIYAPNAILLFRRMNAQLIDLNPVQHQAFADEINGLEQQLADNNFGGLQNRIDELRAQIEEALG